MNNFVEAARAAVRQYPLNDPRRVVLEYLLDYAVGRWNAKPWPVIENALRVRGVIMEKNFFQQNILKDSRAGNVFIGSTDNGIERGYFLIETYEDAMAMIDFYKKRIAAETRNLQQCEKLAKEQWPNERSNLLL